MSCIVLQPSWLPLVNNALTCVHVHRLISLSHHHRVQTSSPVYGQTTINTCSCSGQLASILLSSHQHIWSPLIVMIYLSDIHIMLTEHTWQHSQVILFMIFMGSYSVFNTIFNSNVYISTIRLTASLNFQRNATFTVHCQFQISSSLSMYTLKHRYNKWTSATGKVLFTVTRFPACVLWHWGLRSWHWVELLSQW